MSILDMRVPREAADWLDIHKWVQHAGDGVTCGCLHTALLRPCSAPGDNVLWHHLMCHRSYTEVWNDTPGRRKAQVTGVLRRATEPTELEMVAMLGPQWFAIRDLVRRAAVLTPDEVQELGAARGCRRDAAWRAAWRAARDAAWDAIGDAPRGAARVTALLAVRGAAGGVAGDTTREAAGDAAVAVVVRDLIVWHGFTVNNYRTLTGPWASVIGPAHPDDPKDGLA